MRIGLLGGTFDPIHQGHLDLAHAARRALSLDLIWVVPTRQPPHRTAPEASAAHRFAMAALAIGSQDGLLLSDLEMDTPGPSYTTETLDRIESSGRPLRSLFLVLGADAFRDVRLWKGFPAILDRCHFGVIARPGLGAREAVASVPEAGHRLANLPGDDLSQPSVFAIEAVTAPISSTEVRRALAAGAVLDGLVPGPVAHYIAAHGLYRPAKASDNDPLGAA